MHILKLETLSNLDSGITLILLNLGHNNQFTTVTSHLILKRIIKFFMTSDICCR